MLIKKFIVLLTMIFLSNMSSSANSRFPGEWSFMLDGNIFTNYGISPSMLGTMEEFYTEFEETYENSKYPFSNDDIFSSNLRGQIAYRFPESAISIYFNLGSTYFLTPKYYFFEGTDRVSLFIGTFTPGIEYCFGESEDLWNVFGRAGICFSSIGSTVYYLSQKIRLTGLYRIGFETEIGGRLNIPRTPVSIEIITNYTNSNLFLKNYQTPALKPPQLIFDRDINDGAGGTINSGDKTIDFLCFKIGARLWF
ncbi:MAG: hypothetical protein V1779_14115 [bacterium]